MSRCGSHKTSAAASVVRAKAKVAYLVFQPTSAARPFSLSSYRGRKKLSWKKSLKKRVKTYGVQAAAIVPNPTTKSVSGTEFPKRGRFVVEEKVDRMVVKACLGDCDSKIQLEPKGD